MMILGLTKVLVNTDEEGTRNMGAAQNRTQFYWFTWILQIWLHRTTQMLIVINIKGEYCLGCVWAQGCAA